MALTPSLLAYVLTCPLSPPTSLESPRRPKFQCRSSRHRHSRFPTKTLPVFSMLHRNLTTLCSCSTLLCRRPPICCRSTWNSLIRSISTRWHYPLGLTILSGSFKLYYHHRVHRLDGLGCPLPPLYPRQVIHR
ncbi:hypothetical protein B0H10DRAFT_2090275 [Mycena sp. CBHHK59/15]|nr:hypothetical protein B0H10DRAFT_2090275 [Mycena sp. CBHHK59/15]